MQAWDEKGVRRTSSSLLDDSAGIGTRERWEARLAERGYQIVGHELRRSAN